MKHIPVMTKQVIEYLAPKQGSIYVDATLGGGGHAKKIAQSLNGKCQIIGIDQDPEALKIAHQNLIQFSKKIIYIQGNFRNLDQILDDLKIYEVDGILLDLGVSSLQLEDPKRGFSFDAPTARLDMRMDLNQSTTAYEVVNNYTEMELRHILFELGEERFAKSIARKIVLIRVKKPIETIGELIEIIKSATPPKYRFSKHIHFATNVFRAFRMEVNQELSALEEVIPIAISRLKKGGRLVIISFQSLEDRIVKHYFRQFAASYDTNPIIKILTKKPLTPTDEEVSQNSSARSAKLRAVEKL